MKKKKATIQDIANALGISRNTVSKALNNADGIADSTKEKILQKAVEMDYKTFSYVRTLGQEAVAQSVRNGLSEAPAYHGQIALLTSLFLGQSHFSFPMLDKFQNELAQLGYTLNTHRVTKDDLRLLRLPATFIPELYTGIICFEMFDPAYGEMLCSLDIPILFVDGPCKKDGFSLPADQLYMNNTDCIVRFVSNMLNNGYRSIGWVGDYLHCQSFYERYTAFRTAMMLADVPVNEHFIIRTIGLENTSAGLAPLTEYPEIFICANDFIAADVMQVLSAKGLVVPRDIMICGFDDSPESSIVYPSLTTIHIHTQVMAYEAAHLLISRIREPSLDYRAIYTETDLVIRESTNLKG